VSNSHGQDSQPSGDMEELSIRFSFDHEAKQIVVHSGKVEIGQHIHTAFQKIVADTLKINALHVRSSPVTTQFSPNDGMTVGSLSMQITGASLQSAAAALRTTMYREASQILDTDPDEITLNAETLEFLSEGTCCFIFDLPMTKNAVVTASHADNVAPTAKTTITASIVGERQYIQDLVLPGMIHARALRGRYYPNDNSDTSTAKNTAGNTDDDADTVQLIDDGGFSALVARTEVALEKAWSKIQTEPVGRDSACDGPIASWIQHRRVETQESGETSSINGSVIQKVTRPFLLHASIAPSCAIACFEQGKLKIWTHSQGIFPLRDTIASYLNMQVDDVVVQHVPSAGCYGHSAADDAVMDAVLVSLQHEGTPVRVVWTRHDDFQYSPVGAAMQVQVDAQLSDDNSIEHWRQTIWSCPHAMRPGTGGNVNLLAAIEQDSKNKSKTISDLPETIGGGAARNAKPPYSIKSFGTTTHLVQDLPVRTSSIRGLGAHMNVVCIEAAMDKLASSCNTGSLEFRLKQLEDPRGCNVLRQLNVEMDKACISLQENEAIGFGYSRYKEKAAYAAVAAHVRLTDKVELINVWSVVDAGHIVDRSGAINQIEGGIIQAASWTLCEGVTLRGGFIDASGWDDYPILGWSEIPNIQTTLVGEQGELPYLGVGECMVGPASAAIVNGVSNAAGDNMTDLPLTYEKFLKTVAQ